MSEPLKMWTVYDRPKDFPDTYVARLWLATHPEPTPTQQIVRGSLELIRAVMRGMGLVCMARSEGDDPKIVETWL